MAKKMKIFLAWIACFAFADVEIADGQLEYACFEDFNILDSSCQWKNEKRIFAETREECCKHSRTNAYASTGWSINPNVHFDCKSCKTVRSQNAVYCFNFTYDEEARTCHQLQSFLASDVEECCTQTTGSHRGYSTTLDIIDDTVPTYHCSFCKERFANASVWTEWTSCSASCGGGKQTRFYTCKDEQSNVTCHGRRQEEQECNTRPCPEEKDSPLERTELGSSNYFNNLNDRLEYACFTNFDAIDGTCKRTSQIFNFARTPQECCEYSQTMGYASVNPNNNTSERVDCDSCEYIRPKNVVYCFHLIYYEGARTCHQLHPLQASTREECCTSRSGPPQGYAFKLNIHDAAIPTYQCSFCKEHFVKASIWTKWTSCSASCGGGKQTRFYTCREDQLASNVTCHGRRQEEQECNAQPCSHEMNPVYCFNLTYSEVSRTCHQLQTLQASTPEECCLRRSGPPQGYSTKLDVHNSTIPSYLCSFCKERFVRASIWTEWSNCSASCGGGTQKRSYTCTEDRTTSNITCYGEKREERACNTEPCPKETNPVYCFNLMYYEGSRTCHQLQSLQASTPEECCFNKFGPPQGYALKLDVHNATIPTFLCSICKERFVRASIWTEWSNCSASCGSGKRKRSYTCTDDQKTANIICHGEEKEEQECYIQPCSETPNEEYACFENFDNFDSTCQWNSEKSKMAKTPEECCEYSGTVAFASVKSKDNLSGPFHCDSCDNVRHKHAVYCFDLIHDEEAKTCRQLQSNQISTREDCCQYGNGPSKGYSLQLDVYNDTIPTYFCSLCKEHFVKASIWTEWGECSATCGGGKRMRKYTCEEGRMTSNVTCYEERQDVQECNTEPCHQPSNGQLMYACFESFDNFNSTCQWNSGKSKLAKTPEECCEYSTTAAFAPVKSKDNLSGSFDCDSCENVRNKGAVHCFNLIYYEGSRTCHQLQPLQSSTAEECCTLRSGPPLGYALKLDVHDATVPTYLCSFCKERFARASLWSQWSVCSASCDGGIRKRSYTCTEDQTILGVTCYGEKQEEQECNNHPCPERASTSSNTVTALAVVFSLILIGVLCCFMWIIYFRYKANGNSTRNVLPCCYREEKSLLTTSVNSYQHVGHIKRQTPPMLENPYEYIEPPIKRQLPDIPESYMEMERTEKLPDIPESYMEMETKEILPYIPDSYMEMVSTDKLPDIEMRLNDKLSDIPEGYIEMRPKDKLPDISGGYLEMASIDNCKKHNDDINSSQGLDRNVQPYEEMVQRSYYNVPSPGTQPPIYMEPL